MPIKIDKTLCYPDDICYIIKDKINMVVIHKDTRMITIHMDNGDAITPQLVFESIEKAEKYIEEMMEDK